MSAESALTRWTGALPMPAWLLRDDGQVRADNAAARQLQQLGLAKRDITGRLLRIGSLDVPPALFATAAQGLPQRLVTVLGSGAAPQRAAVHLCASDSGRVLVLVEHCTPAPDSDASWFGLLSHRYALSRTESNVLAHLTAGMEVPDIAAALNIGVHTVRTHLRGLREKTQRRSQVALVRLGLGR